jgi:hypothetical protein
MTMHINFITRACPVCGRDITRPNYTRHVEACERKHKAVAPKETDR